MFSTRPTVHGEVVPPGRPDADHLLSHVTHVALPSATQVHDRVKLERQVAPPRRPDLIAGLHLPVSRGASTRALVDPVPVTSIPAASVEM
jgi:hypothetical protein